MSGDEEIDITIQDTLEYDADYSPWCDDVDHVRNSAKKRKNVAKELTNEQATQRTDDKQQVEHANNNCGS